jgi:hypothetical protein
MKKLLTSLALSISLASSVSAALNTYIDESFDGVLPSGFPGAYSMTDFDGVGGSAQLLNDTFTGYDLPGSATLADAITAGSFDFSFFLDTTATANFAGARIKIFSLATNSSGGFGINFNYTLTTDTFTVWAHNIATQSTSSMNFAAGSKISGSVSFPTATSAIVTITNGVTSVVSSSVTFDPATVTGDRIVFRAGGVDTTYLVDGINVISGSAVPEPSSFAALAGIGALGFVACRRRRRV